MWSHYWHCSLPLAPGKCLDRDWIHPCATTLWAKHPRKNELPLVSICLPNISSQIRNQNFWYTPANIKYKKHIYIYIKTHTHLHACMRTYMTWHDIALHYTVLQHMTWHYIAVHCVTLHYITLHCITLPYLTLHYSTVHYITVPYLALQTNTHTNIHVYI